MFLQSLRNGVLQWLKRETAMHAGYITLLKNALFYLSCTANVQKNNESVKKNIEKYRKNVIFLLLFGDFVINYVK